MRVAGLPVDPEVEQAVLRRLAPFLEVTIDAQPEPLATSLRQAWACDSSALTAEVEMWDDGPVVVIRAAGSLLTAVGAVEVGIRQGFEDEWLYASEAKAPWEGPR